MHSSFALLSIAALTASASVIKNGKRDTGLEVTLSSAEGAAQVLATIKNVGAQDINLLTLGTFLDSAPVQKLAVSDETSKSPRAFIIC